MVVHLSGDRSATKGLRQAGHDSLVWVSRPDENGVYHFVGYQNNYGEWVDEEGVKLGKVTFKGEGFN